MGVEGKVHVSCHVEFYWSRQSAVRINWQWDFRLSLLSRIYVVYCWLEHVNCHRIFIPSTSHNTRYCPTKIWPAEEFNIGSIHLNETKQKWHIVFYQLILSIKEVKRSRNRFTLFIRYNHLSLHLFWLLK